MKDDDLNKIQSKNSDASSSGNRFFNNSSNEVEVNELNVENVTTPDVELDNTVDSVSSSDGSSENMEFQLTNNSSIPSSSSSDSSVANSSDSRVADVPSNNYDNPDSGGSDSDMEDSPNENGLDNTSGTNSDSPSGNENGLDNNPGSDNGSPSNTENEDGSNQPGSDDSPNNVGNKNNYGGHSNNPNDPTSNNIGDSNSIDDGKKQPDGQKKPKNDPQMQNKEPGAQSNNSDGNNKPPVNKNTRPEDPSKKFANSNNDKIDSNIGNKNGKNPSSGANSLADKAKNAADSAKQAGQKAKDAAQKAKNAANKAKKAASAAKNAVTSSAFKAKLIAILSNPITWLVLGIFFVVLIIGLLILSIFVTLNQSSGTSYTFWWPIGSEEETVHDVYGGDPVSTYISSPYGMRADPYSGEEKLHAGIDIAGPQGVPVIASKAGEIIQAVDGCVAGNKTCGGGFGNHVKIDHGDGYVTVYAHLYSIEVTMGENVVQGQLIGGIGTTGYSTGNHLHFEIIENGVKVDPELFVSIDNPRPTGLAGGLSNIALNDTSLSRSEFVDKASNYGQLYGGSNYSRYISPNLSEIYSSSLRHNINPELVITRAVVEGYSPGGASNNLWGIGCYNGCSSCCNVYPSLDAGIKAFADIVNSYGSIEAAFAKYAYIGAHWYNPGSWSNGGCPYYPYVSKYLSAARSSQVAAACSGSYCGVGGGAGCMATTTEDQNAYTSFQLEKMNSVHAEIFN